MRGAAPGLLGLFALALLSLALVSNRGVGPVSTLDYVAPQPAVPFGETRCPRELELSSPAS
jgi:hypothetical protein